MGVDEARVAADQPAGSAPNKERVGSIDALRSVMCIGIALNHFVPYFFRDNDVEIHVASYFSYFTDLFAVFAGLFAAPYLSRRWSTGSYRAFIAARTARLYPLHLVTMSFYAVLAVPISWGWLQPDNVERYSMAALIPHLTLTHAWGFGPPMAFNYPSWMISGIFGCYLVLPLLGWAHRSSRWAGLAILVAVMACCTWAASLLGSEITMVQGEGLGVLRILPSFVFGLLIGQWPITHASRAGSLLLLVGVLALAFGAPEPVEGVARLALLYMLVYAVLLADRSRLQTPLRSPLLQAGAKFSFGVYLWHGLVATCLFRLAVPRLMGDDLFRIGDEHPLIAYGLIASGVGAAFLLASISLRTIERHGTDMFIWMWSGPRRMVMPENPTSS